MATFERHVDVEWTGGLMDGSGQAKAGTGAFTQAMTFPSRIGEGDGKTTPEEMIAQAAEKGCPISNALRGNVNIPVAAKAT